jgi:hypothetical protein
VIPSRTRWPERDARSMPRGARYCRDECARSCRRAFSLVGRSAWREDPRR